MGSFGLTSKDCIPIYTEKPITDKDKFFNDAFEWWFKYKFSEEGIIEYKLETTKYRIINEYVRTWRFFEKLETLPEEHFEGKTFYDFLTGIQRFTYVPTMRKDAYD